MKLILASESEWRRRLISWLDVDYEVQISGVDEELYESEEVDELVVSLAVVKAREVVKKRREKEVDMNSGRIVVVGADTMIALEGGRLGKPENLVQAREMIKQLQGKTHEVLTGICVMDLDSMEMLVEVETTKVLMKEMSDKQIDEYLKTGEWEGKAGGYQILLSIDKYIEKVEGSVTNVIGLPLGTLADMLDEFGITIDTNLKEVIRRETGYDE